MGAIPLHRHTDHATRTISSSVLNKPTHFHPDFISYSGPGTQNTDIELCNLFDFHAGIYPGTYQVFVHTTPSSGTYAYAYAAYDYHKAPIYEPLVRNRDTVTLLHGFHNYSLRRRPSTLQSLCIQPSVLTLIIF